MDYLTAILLAVIVSGDSVGSERPNAIERCFALTVDVFSRATRQFAAVGILPPGPWLLTSQDLRIGDHVTQYLDPEFLPEHNLMCWQDGADHLWVCEIIPETGELNPSDGRGVWIGRGAPIIRLDEPLRKIVTNGPEFGISRRGIGVYYISVDDPANYRLARYDLKRKTTEMLGSETVKDVIGALISTDHLDEGCRVLYARKDVSQPDHLVQAGWFEELQPQTAGPVPFSELGTSGAPWVPGERAVITNLADDTGVVQVARYDVDAGQVTYLTSGPDNKVDAIAFVAPEYPGELLFLAIADHQWLDIYRQNSSGWSRIRRIGTPDADRQTGEAQMTSAEPITYRGRTYLTYRANDASGASRIALAAIGSPLNRWVSDPSAPRQYDPEAAVFDDRLYVYYYLGKTHGNVGELRRCEIRLWP